MTIYYWLAIAAAWLGLMCVIAIQYRKLKYLAEERERWRKAYEDFVEEEQRKRSGLPPSGSNRRANRF